MQQIADWLEKLGMSEYAQRVAENGIDFSVLAHLTDQDLKDIGVLLGHRRKMLAAITEITGTAPASPAPAPTTEHKSQDTAEPVRPLACSASKRLSTELDCQSALERDP